MWKKWWCISIHVSQSPAHYRVFTSSIWHSDKCHQFHSGTTSYKYRYVQFSPRQDSPGRTFEYYRLLTSPRLFPTAPPSYNSTVCVEKRESTAGAAAAGYKPRAVCVPGNWPGLVPPQLCVIERQLTHKLFSVQLRGKWQPFSFLLDIY